MGEHIEINEHIAEPYKAYALLDERGCILDVNCSEWMQDATGWILIDEGYGDKYHHAQGNYLPGPTTDMDGIPLYLWDGAQVIRRTDKEIEADRASLPTPGPTREEQMRADIDFLAALGGVML